MLRLNQHATVDITAHHIVMDGETWRRAGTVLEGLYDSLAWSPEISFSYRDSKNTPGIQLADLAAHARRLRLTAGECTNGSKAIDEMRL
ncbi:hypothetical protein HAL_27780 [Haladaptatus sp. T7]|nr:hypothetical protein HAL_27780 [Haladaptatus sp. T7]